MQLKYTLDEVRARETAHLGEVRWPVPWWPPGRASNYCLGWQTVTLGLRSGQETTAWLAANRHMISIAAFRAHYQFPEVDAKNIRPGDLVISNWTGDRLDGRLEADHLEWAYSHDRDGQRLVVVGANTGPAAGDPTPNGVWKKARPLDGHILFGIRLPYRPDKPSVSRKHTVKTVAVFLNAQPLGSIPRTSASGPGKDTGLEGPIYWRRVQTWGRKHGYYGSAYTIDGIPGPQTRIVEAAAYKAATAKK